MASPVVPWLLGAWAAREAALPCWATIPTSACALAVAATLGAWTQPPQPTQPQRQTRPAAAIAQCVAAAAALALSLSVAGVLASPVGLECGNALAGMLLVVNALFDAPAAPECPHILHGIAAAAAVYFEMSSPTDARLSHGSQGWAIARCVLCTLWLAWAPRSHMPAGPVWRCLFALTLPVLSACMDAAAAGGRDWTESAAYTVALLPCMACSCAAAAQCVLAPALRALAPPSDLWHQEAVIYIAAWAALFAAAPAYLSTAALLALCVCMPLLSFIPDRPHAPQPARAPSMMFARR